MNTAAVPVLDMPPPLTEQQLRAAGRQLVRQAGMLDTPDLRDALAMIGLVPYERGVRPRVQADRARSAARRLA